MFVAIFKIRHQFKLMLILAKRTPCLHQLLLFSRVISEVATVMMRGHLVADHVLAPDMGARDKKQHRRTFRIRAAITEKAPILAIIEF